MNGNSGIVPTVDLATNNTYPYPVMYGNGGFGGNGMFGGDAIWLIVLLALIWNGNNGNGFFGGNGGFDNGYAWLSNGQKEIMNNTNNGFDTLHLSNNIEGVRDAVSGLSNQICNSTASVVQSVNSGFAGVEANANTRHVADMTQNFNNQIATLQGFNGLQKSLDTCCCENRLATCQTQNIVQNEGNATRFADANNTRDIITNATANTQAILDKLCSLELNAKQDRIDELERQNLMLSLDKSQTAQNSFIAQGFANEIDQMYNRLATCPINTIPVYGNQRIFTCSNNGCGCGNYYGANIM